MQLVISKKELVRGLGRTHSVADRKSSMPILSNVLLSTDGPKSARFSATDLYLAVSATADAEVKKGGNVAVSARNLFEIAKNLPEGEVTIAADDVHLVEIRSGKVRYKIPGMPGEDFPALPSPGKAPFFELYGEIIARLIALTYYSMSLDETRPHLASALFEGEARTVRMVTTDGHRLSKAEYRLSDTKEMLNFKMLIPSKGIFEIKRMIEDSASEKTKGEEKEQRIAIASAGGNAYFRRENILLSVKLTDEEFPPYAKVIPQSQSKKMVIDRMMLLEALKRISLVAKEKSGVVRFHLESGILRIDSESSEIGEGMEEMEVDYEGETMIIGFNARYMQEAMSAINEDEIAIELGAELDPGVIRPVGATDFVGVVMPMRI